MIPRTERVVVTYFNTKEETIAILTQKPTDGSFFLYEISGRDIKRLGKAQIPLSWKKNIT